jgi:hypothetical protein
MTKAKSKPSGAAIEMPHGVTVHCPESGGTIESPVTVEFSGGQISCPDVRSLVNTLSLTLSQFLATNKNEVNSKRGSGPERAWAEAREYAKNYNKGKPESEHITDDQARKLLSDQKKQQKLEALLRKSPLAKKRKKSA